MEELLEGLMDVIEDIMYALFGGGIWYESSIYVWNLAIDLISTLMGYTPEEFSAPAWEYIINTVYSFNLSIGAVMLNLWYMAGLIRHCSNLKENLTLEIVLDGLIKIMLSNFLLLNGLPLMKSVFKISALMSQGFLSVESLTFRTFQMDMSSVMFMHSLGVLYFIVSLVCAGLVFFSVYGRYMHLYALVGIAPIAWSTIPGGHGISNSASAWLRTFLSKTFETVVISIFIGIAGKLCESINFGQMDGVGQLFNGWIQLLQNMAVMIILAAGVKGSEQFLKRAMAL